MITVKEAADILGVTTKTVYHLIDQGRLPSHRLGDQYYLERNDITNYMAESGKQIAEVSPVEIDTDIHLSDMLAHAGIFYNVPGNTKTEALHNALKLINGIDLKVMQPIFQMFLSREELASTGIGNGIAIPHARGTLVGYINQPLLSLSFLEKPIEYDAIDQKPVNILFLLISPNVQTHLRILAKLSYLLQDPVCREVIISQSPLEAILSAITQAEQRFGRQA